MPDILLVDDDHDTTAFLSRVLSASIDCEPRVATTNEQARALLSSRWTDLLVTDLRRAGGSGEELIMEVRTRREFGDPAIVIVSGALFRDGAFDPRVFQFRIDAAFGKPFAIPHFLDAVGRSLRVPLSPDLALVRAGTESRELDYKERIDLAVRSQRASLAKDVLAFSNTSGGDIVIGVREERPGEFLPIGVQESDLPSFEITRLYNALRPFAGENISVQPRLVRDGELTFVIIHVSQSKTELRMALAEDASARLFLGRIYVRSAAAESCEARDPATLRHLFDRLIRSNGGRRDDP